MHIYNRTRQTTLATAARRAQSYKTRLLGLMFQNHLPEGEALLLEPESSIHTFFMRFPIDVLYLDKSYSVLRADPAMPPNRIGPLVTRGCHAVLELPPGTIAATQTEVGDQLSLVSEA
ncbi:MAG: DUF192 domain-containing protein [Ardenticatenales bacterium]|nr:DUF192 domain-containing protein [Ardenticatenales bacterium]